MGGSTNGAGVGDSGRHDSAVQMELMAQASRSIAHDLRNVFSVINACAVDLYDEMHGRRAGALVLEILNAAERGLLATTDLMRAGDDSADEAVIDLCRQTGDLEVILRRLAGPSVEVSVRCVGGPVFVRIDRTSVMQILMNLVSNAADAMQRSGSIRVEVGTAMRVAGRGQPERVATLSVTDDGPGIAPDILPHLFDDGFSTKTGPHLGLGLAVVRRVVERCGGSIEVQSQVGAGTTFKVKLPLVERVRTGVALVVVADDAARALYAAALGAEGLQVLVAADALDACDAVAGQPAPDVAVLDADAAADSGLWQMASLDDAGRTLAVGEGTPVALPATPAEAVATLRPLIR